VAVTLPTINVENVSLCAVFDVKALCKCPSFDVSEADELQPALD